MPQVKKPGVECESFGKDENFSTSPMTPNMSRSKRTQVLSSYSGVGGQCAYTPVTATLVNHTAPGSVCARGCEACLSKLMLVFTCDDPGGPAVTRKQTHSTQMWHAFFIGWGRCASSATAHTFMDVSHHLFDPGGQSSLGTYLITWTHRHQTEFNNKTKDKHQ